MAIVSMLVLAGLACIVPMAGARIVNIENERNIYIYSENLGGQYLYPGDQDVTFYVRIRNNYGGATGYENIYECDCRISGMVTDEDGIMVDTPVLMWDTQEVDDNVTINDGSYWTFSYFEFDIKPDAKPGTYNFTVEMRYKTPEDFVTTFIGFIHWDIRSRATVGDITGLLPGDKNKEVSFRVDVYTTMIDTQLELTTPATDFKFFGGSRTASAYREGAYSFDWYPNYVVSVGAFKQPGTYEGTYTLMCKNSDDIVCTETGTMDYYVGCLPMVSIDLYDDLIDQGTTTATLDLSFENTGNVALYEVEVRIDDISGAFMFTKADHFVGDEMEGDPWIKLADKMEISERANVQVEVALDRYIPMGTHKILLDFKGFYFDSLEMVHTITASYWTQTTDGVVPVVYFDGSYNILDPDETQFDGTYFKVDVRDMTMDVSVTCRNVPSMGSQVVDKTLDLVVENYGNIDFSNVVLRMETNTEETPFINCVDSNAELSEEVKLPGTLWAGTKAYVELHVSFKPTARADIYMVPVTITGVNVQEGTLISTIVNARVTVRGIGPVLEISDVSPAEIDAGEDFTLSLTVSNIGDDTARNAVITTAAPGFDELAGLLGGGTEPSEINGDLAPPEAVRLPMFIGDIPPGAFQVVNIDMRCNPDMTSGHVFPMAFVIDYTDSYGNRPSSGESIHEVSVKSTGEGGAVESKLYSSGNTLLWVATFALIILVIFYAIAQIGRMKGERPPREPKPKAKAAPAPQPQPPTQPTPQQQPAQPAPPPQPEGGYTRMRWGEDQQQQGYGHDQAPQTEQLPQTEQYPSVDQAPPPEAPEAEQTEAEEPAAEGEETPPEKEEEK
jgi:hypothetical protein